MSFVFIPNLLIIIIGLFRMSLKYYALIMTLAQRNRYFKGGIIFSALCLAVLAVQAGKVLPLYPELCETALRRSQGISQNLAARFFPPVPQTSFVTMTLAVIYALTASALVFFFFEKTHCPEILFFGLFALSFAFEIFRIIVPLQRFYRFSQVLLIPGTRMLIFGRFFGLLSLLASGIYAAGLEIQKQGKVIIAIIISILVISLRIPVNSFSWDSSMTVISAYSSTFRFAEQAVTLISIISFLVAAYTRGNGEYLFIALGAFLVCFGRSLLLSADTWITPIPALAMLAAGTWFVLMRLHQVYLWL